MVIGSNGNIGFETAFDAFHRKVLFGTALQGPETFAQLALAVACTHFGHHLALHAKFAFYVGAVGVELKQYGQRCQVYHTKYQE